MIIGVYGVCVLAPFTYFKYIDVHDKDALV